MAAMTAAVVLAACPMDPPRQPDPAGADASPTDAGDAAPELRDLGGDDPRPDLSGPASPIDHALPYAEDAPTWGDEGLTLGVGKEELVEVRQGDVNRWEAGPQGGHHLWVSCALDPALLAGLSGDELDTLSILYRVWREDGTLLARTRRLGGLRRGEDGRWYSVGQYAVLEAPVRPRRLDDELLLYRVDVALPQEDSPRHRASWITSQCCD